MKHDERRWKTMDEVLYTYTMESQSLSSLQLQSKGALAIPTLQSWRRLDGKWCGKMHSERTSWTFIVHKAGNLNLTRINVFLGFWYGLCMIVSHQEGLQHFMLWHNMNMQWRYEDNEGLIVNSIRTTNIWLSIGPERFHQLMFVVAFMAWRAPLRLQRLAKMKHPTIWLLNYAPVAPCWKRLRIATLENGRIVSMLLGLDPASRGEICRVLVKMSDTKDHVWPHIISDDLSFVDSFCKNVSTYSS